MAGRPPGSEPGPVTLPRVVILGGGPAGCGAAYRLAQSQKARVAVIERQPVVGGNAGSFQWAGQWLDYGSHRLHHTVAPEILEDIRSMLGSDCGDFPRHGRIRLRGRWLHFPLQTTDLLRHLDKSFAVAMVRDLVAGKIARRDEGETFASVLLANLGPTMCHHFYFPYARKLWGCEPEELAGIQARKRVTAGSFGKLVRRLLKPVGGGYYYYMREGYGQLSRAYADHAQRRGAEFALGWSVARVVRLRDDRGWRVSAVRNGETRNFEADYLWSTIPLTRFAELAEPAPPESVLEAAKRLDYRAMVLVYAQLPVARFSETDAHYFPESDIRMTRLSEPKNYFRLSEPAGTTVLCGEYPCAVGDEIWSATDTELGEQMARDAATAGIPFPAAPVDGHVRRLPQAYPIYRDGYEEAFAALDAWFAGDPRVLVFGRQGLFAHDNTHHALFMAYSAVDCLDPSGFDLVKWANYRRLFETHVVED